MKNCDSCHWRSENTYSVGHLCLNKIPDYISNMQHVFYGSLLYKKYMKNGCDNFLYSFKIKNENNSTRK